MTKDDAPQGLAAALNKVQSELKAPKNQFNKFGGYYYRSAEDIIEAVKPLLVRYGLTMTIADEIVQVGDRYYVKAIVGVNFGEGDNMQSTAVSAFAREDESKKGMDGAQITGTASSYARKYALNGMFLIDDTKDNDTEHTQATERNQNVEDAVKLIKSCTTAAEFKEVFHSLGSLTNNPKVVKAVREKKVELTSNGG